MFTNCLFCKFPFAPIDLIEQHEEEGKGVKTVKCHECGAEYKVVILIERGPTRKFVENKPS